MGFKFSDKYLRLEIENKKYQTTKQVTDYDPDFWIQISKKIQGDANAGAVEELMREVLIELFGTAADELTEGRSFADLVELVGYISMEFKKRIDEVNESIRFSSARVDKRNDKFTN
ncbi:MAG: hypothetical protein Q4Q17_01120 [Tissierellia bacterium]|nr:hypothetical protein [Tissierellia bacterium]